ncbi:helix-turn-helix domain-containing protein [Halegenticoccus soli]|uniref:helix-turn-helix domain-containing protein n=1 Tax=Halegenticoccus soli TaxID=1985678 RepID=UPI000C6DCC30|nr:helix-turn-helix domain-containing protein [Halegenticoccus soli]
MTVHQRNSENSLISAKFVAKLPLLQQSLASVPDLVLTVEPGQYPFVGDKSSKLLIWASGDDFERFETSVQEDLTVMEIEPVASLDNARLYRIDFLSEELEALFATLFYDHDTFLVKCRVTHRGWEIWLHALNKSAISLIYGRLESRNIPVDVQSIYSNSDYKSPMRNLSEEQYEALSVAYDRGYFKIPREITLEELAEEIPVSSQALSERLRRGTAAVLKEIFDGSDTVGN